MPWKETTSMSLRLEFVTLALSESVTMRSLCQRFGISTKTGYKWLHRFHDGGEEALADLSRRPLHSPNLTSQSLEQAILTLRSLHPAWGPRKIHACLSSEFPAPLPAISTIAAILKRNGQIDPAQSLKHKPWQRFEATSPNQLWQIDFKGHFPFSSAGRCHPLDILDDHSRFLVGLRACLDETAQTVKAELTTLFRHYGLPERMLFDNGGPWGYDREHPYTALVAWLIRLGISFSHSRPCHPQTLGKTERFNRTLKAELLSLGSFQNLAQAQRGFDWWRDCYNFERPHQSLAMAVPASRYQPSPKEFPEKLPPIEYGSDYQVRKVQGKGEISFHNREYKVGRAFVGNPVGLRPARIDGLYEVYFCHERIATIDLNEDTSNRSLTD
jgi:transposase InsO family protein